jgi:hypothetical protein
MKFFAHLMSFIPTRLPVGLTEFHTWADEVIALAGNFADRDSMVHALANMIQHSSHSKAFVSKRYFANCLVKAASNQIAAQAILDIRDAKAKVEADAKALADEVAKQLAAVTASPAETANVTTQAQAPQA